MWDNDVKGFGARRQQDQISFFLKTRIKGQQRWITIGRNGSPWSPETARKEAIQLMATAHTGEDPTEQRRRERAPKPIFADFAQTFLTVHGPKLKSKTRVDYDGLLRLHLLPAFGRRRVEDISKSDVASFHAKLADKPRTANYAIAVLSKMMAFAEHEGIRKDHSNPCLVVERFREAKRDRYLSEDELAKLGQALNQAQATANPYVIAAIRLLLLTGARLNEILSLQWKFIDVERKIAALPDSKTGAKLLPLNQPALDVLASLTRIQDNPYVLPGHLHGSHLVNIQKPWRAIRAAAGLHDVRLHDLRHSFASVAINQGSSLSILGKVLGHSQPQTTARYAHIANQPVSQVSEAAAQEISRRIAKPN